MYKSPFFYIFGFYISTNHYEEENGHEQGRHDAHAAHGGRARLAAVHAGELLRVGEIDVFRDPAAAEPADESPYEERAQEQEDRHARERHRIRRCHVEENAGQQTRGSQRHAETDDHSDHNE